MPISGKPVATSGQPGDLKLELILPNFHTCEFTCQASYLSITVEVYTRDGFDALCQIFFIKWANFLQEKEEDYALGMERIEGIKILLVISQGILDRDNIIKTLLLIGLGVRCQVGYHFILELQ